jgi:hypothetical protein
VRLTDAWFEAEFYGNVTATGFRRQGASIEGAQGIVMYCPCHYGHDDGAHGLIVPFANPRNAPSLPEKHGPSERGNPDVHPRWGMSGTGLNDLTITPSVDVGEPSCWHGLITNGEVT